MSKKWRSNYQWLFSYKECQKFQESKTAFRKNSVFQNAKTNDASNRGCHSQNELVNLKTNSYRNTLNRRAFKFNEAVKNWYR